MIDNKLTYISLFSSAAVGCYGFKEEGFECIATNEIIKRRIDIQKLNKKCRYDSGYINDDITLKSTKDKIYLEIAKWKEKGNDEVDVVIATAPCQGMSVANHKKNEKDLSRNSLINESVNIIKNIKPKIFLFENVPSFWKTGCINKDNNLVEIGFMINEELSSKYIIYNKIINFKNYGSNSSRTRTLVIGVRKDLSEYLTPYELFPSYRKEKTLYESIKDMKSLDWGEFDPNDFYHSFRLYPEHMRAWIHDLKEGESAFDNLDITKRPHKIINGEIIVNQSKNADKYKRQIYNKVAPCIHTRNDQMASQNTLHPKDDRVFSIRELMMLMSIPQSFKWLDYSLEELNNLSDIDKRKIAKKEEMNIRQAIGEAVPTIIFREIAAKIKQHLNIRNLSKKEIKELIKEHDLIDNEKLINYIKLNKDLISKHSLSVLFELSNSSRESNSAYFTNKYIIQEIIKELPDFEDKKQLKILEPSVGCGNFLPFLFLKYSHIEKVEIIVIDKDINSLNVLKLLFNKDELPTNFSIKYVCEDYLDYKGENIDLVIGNPPFSKISKEYKKKYITNNYNKETNNIAELFLEKAIRESKYVSLIMPKNLLNTPEYIKTREFLEKFSIDSILDFGERGFNGVLIETINIMVNTVAATKNVKIISFPLNKTLICKASYIFDKKFPYWIIYRDSYFDKVFKKMKFDIFDVFRDRQVINSMFSKSKKDNDIRVLKSRNISDNADTTLDIKGYDSYISKDILPNLAVSKYYNDNSVYLTPNMTYNPRLLKKKGKYIVNGSVAILIPKENIELNEKQRSYISSKEFREFYKIARNFQTRSLNIDKSSCFWFGILREEN